VSGGPFERGPISSLPQGNHLCRTNRRKGVGLSEEGEREKKDLLNYRSFPGREKPSVPQDILGGGGTKETAGADCLVGRKEAAPIHPCPPRCCQIFETEKAEVTTKKKRRKSTRAKGGPSPRVWGGEGKGGYVIDGEKRGGEK